MNKGSVVVYFGELGGRLQEHQRVMLMKDAETISSLLCCNFEGEYRADRRYDGRPFYVPDDTLLSEEASSIGIRAPDGFYGGVVPFPFVKTKAISHGLLDTSSAHPVGWSSDFSQRVREVVLQGYTAFSYEDAKLAASQMLSQGPVRIKSPLGASGKGQEVISTVAELDRVQEQWDENDLNKYGVVLEEDLRNPRTFSVGLVRLRDITVAYCGTQRLTNDNERHFVYGGSTLMCARGGWDALEKLPLTTALRLAVRQARIYDEAMEEYPLFMASRRNYDIGQGQNNRGDWRSGVFESSWRVGGATAAELLAIRSLLADPTLMTVRVSHVEEFGAGCTAPKGSIVHFQGDDPVAGPVIRYTVLKSRLRRNPAAGDLQRQTQTDLHLR